jgi:hypothetical protein
MDIAGRSPELSARVDHEQMLLEVMKQLRVDDPLRFIKKAEEQPALASEMPPAPAMPEGMPPAGGMSIEDQAAMQTIATDGGEQLLNAAEIPTDGVPTDQLQQIMTGALTDVEQPI